MQHLPFLNLSNRLVLIWLLFSSLVPLGLKAGNGNDISEKAANDSAERTLTVSLEYGTNRISYRKKLLDQNVHYYSPSLFYQAPSGFYSGIGAYHLQQPLNRWDETDLDAGWDIGLTKKITFTVDYTHFIYNAQSSQSRAALKNNMELDLDCENEILTPK